MEQDETILDDGVDLDALGIQALQLVHEQATRHPLRTVGVALGVGYVLGGGVPRAVIRLGMIAAARMIVRTAGLEAARGIAALVGVNGATTAPDPDPAPTPPSSGRRRRRSGPRRSAQQPD